MHPFSRGKSRELYHVRIQEADTRHPVRNPPVENYTSHEKYFNLNG